MHMRKWLGTAAITLTVVVGGWAAINAWQVQTKAESGPVSTSNAFTVSEISSPLVGSQAPAFSLPLLDAGVASLADYRGSTVILSFWSTY